MTLELVFKLLLAVALVVGIGGVVHAFRTKMRELADREAVAAESTSHGHPGSEHPAAPRSRPA